MKIFHDGFEINGTTAWDGGVTTASGGSCGTSSTNPVTGTYHLRSTTTGVTASTGYVTRTSSTGGGLAPPYIKTLDGGTTQDFIPGSGTGACHISFKFSVDRADGGTLERHTIFRSMHAGGNSSTDLTGGLELIGGAANGNVWTLGITGQVGSAVLPSFNPTAGTDYRCYVRISRPHLARTTGAVTAYNMTVWVYAVSAPTTLVSRASVVTLTNALESEGLRYLSFGRISGTIIGSPGTINIDIDDVSVNDDQDPNSNGLHTGDPGNTQTQTFDDPQNGTPPTYSEWNSTASPHNTEVQKGSGDSAYIDTDLGADLPRRESFLRTALSFTTEVPIAMTQLVRAGPDAGSAPVFHSIGWLDGSSNEHFSTPLGLLASGLGWCLMVTGEQYGGGALTETYVDNCEFYARKTTNFIGLNDMKITEFFGWTEDDNATADVDYSDQDYNTDRTGGDVT